jgi:copper chaperone NosL
MMRLLNIAVLLFSAMLMAGCTVEPDPILFGVQECAHCRMTITEKAFAAQLVTDKGRTHSFDAIECMMKYTTANIGSFDKVRLFHVADQVQPNDMIDATQAVYVVSASIPSPMGGDLSAYQSQDAALARLGGEEGEILTWVDLIKKFDNSQPITEN